MPFAQFVLSDNSFTGLDFSLPPITSGWYPIPPGSIYLSKTGSDSNDGKSLSTAKATLFGPTGAYNAVPSGGTIVVSSGVYEEGFVGDGVGVSIRTKPFTLQSAPLSNVWFDGSIRVTNWTKVGNVWQTPWTYNPGNTSGFPVGGVGDKPANTYYFDQCFIDDTPQKRVTTITPIAGEFSVVNGVAYIGTDPTGKEVRLTRYRSLAIFASKVNLLGIGVRRYNGGATASNTSIGVTSGYASIYWGGTSEDILIENCSFVDIARLGLSITKPRATVNKCKFIRSGQTHLNVGGERGDGFVFTNNFCDTSNLGRFPREPAAASIKIVKTDKCTITDNVFINPIDSTGIWLDMHVSRMTLARNKIIGGPTCNRAILYEISGGGLLPLTGTRTQNWSYIVNNQIEGDWVWGIFIFDSDYVKIWNNKVGGCKNGQIQVLQDSRPPAPFWPGTYNSGAMDMIVSNIEIVNNDLYGIAGASRIFTGAAPEHYVSTDDAVSLCTGNWFAPGAAAAKWTTSLGTLTTYQTATALDSRAKFVANGWKNFDGSAPPSVRQPLPADIAALM